MFSRMSRSLLSAGLLQLAAVSAAHAADRAPQAIAAVPGKEVCVAGTATVAGNTAPTELCVTGGSFSHDLYALKIGGRTAVKGIDDQTTTGIAGTFNGAQLVLRCVPLELSPKGTPAANLVEVRRVLPGATEARVQELANLLSSIPMGMELGRTCTASSDGQAIISAQVSFD